MNKSKWAVLVLLAVSGALASGCGEGSGRGIRGQVLDSFGKGIANAQVSVIVLPPGGVQELSRMVNSGEDLWGWHFTTDTAGRFRLTGIPTGGLVVAGYTPPHTERTTTNSTAHGSAYGTGGYATGSAHGRSTTRTHVPGQIQYANEPGEWLGFVVEATGYRPYVSMVNFPSPNGGMDAIKLVELGIGKLDTTDDGFKVSLEGLAGKEASSLTESSEVIPCNGHGRPDELRTRTIRVPASVLVQVRQSSGVSAPSWDNGKRIVPVAGEE